MSSLHTLGRPSLRPRLVAYICDACQQRQVRTRASRRASRRRLDKEEPKIPILKNALGSPTIKGEAHAAPSEKPAGDPSYKPAQTWKDLEHIGSPEWLEQKLDTKPTFRGFGQKPPTPIEPRNLHSALRSIAKELGHTSGADQPPDAWLTTPTSTPRAKFQIATLLLRHLGIIISNASLNKAETLSDIQTALTESQKPKKIVNLLSNHAPLVALPNVQVHARRVTPIDEHKRVGRWRLIEDELIKRGLPVTGHNEIRTSIPVVPMEGRFASPRRAGAPSRVGAVKK